MARNRKRRSEARSGRPADGLRDASGDGFQPGVATASGLRRGEATSDPHLHNGQEEAPEPIEHATPDVELAEAQLAVGRPELADAATPDELIAAEAATETEPRRRGSTAVAEQPHAAVAAHRAGLLTRIVHFLQGSWRELQRVQWPDRRQVMQATSVVIGFVIVAGVFLGVADLLAGKVVNFILK